jgi:hypothetical protein
MDREYWTKALRAAKRDHVEDGGDAEPESDDEEDSPPVVVDFVRPKLVAPRRGLQPSRVD